MAIIKCKMCGGNLQIENNESIATCDSCGTQQTLPRLDDERKANLYDRASHFRRNNEFDKAMAMYEKILSEDLTDAEAYWSLVLCRYGIEYVEDPATRKRVPTVNRAQFTSVFDDDNYRSALHYADESQRILYEAEAQTINEIQKGILSISQREEPFDVFICYKETDHNGRRTPDSVLANDLYHELSQEGYKVFFSRITLEDKLGSAYEPYIFAALNSARVMVVLGTRPEYFEAVWVKNEWSRYLALIRDGAKKVLIPAYRDMDPYNLPEEFSHLQAQDMSKLGFMQDLLRGIKKIAGDAEEAQPAPRWNATHYASVNAAPLLRRAYIFLEDGDWESADEYCERVLDMEPENAKAYLGKLLAELNFNRPDDLKSLEEPFDNHPLYQKIMRFADASVKDQVQGYVQAINDRNEYNRKKEILTEILEKIRSASNAGKCLICRAQLEALEDFDGVEKALAECDAKYESICSGIYNNAMAMQQKEDYNGAIQLYWQITNYRNVKEQISLCRKLQELREQQLAIEKAKEEARKKKAKVTAVITIAAMIAMLFLLTQVIIPNVKYSDAMRQMEAGNYSEAIDIFAELYGYKNSSAKIYECNIALADEQYDAALALMNKGKYSEAITAFTEIRTHKDSAEKIKECTLALNDEKYDSALTLINEEKYGEAILLFVELANHKDSKEQVENLVLAHPELKMYAANPGDFINFGLYEQDNKTKNGKEYVEWQVLARQPKRLLVISKYVLEDKPYEEEMFKDVTWATCSLRDWLNNEFYRTAFSVEEQAMISTATVSAHKNPKYSTDPGKDTKDKVFLLSAKEAELYFNSDEARQCEPTTYAKRQWENRKTKEPYAWWTRTPGRGQDDALYVSSGGRIYAYGSSSFIKYGVRPAMWIDLNP